MKALAPDTMVPCALRTKMRLETCALLLSKASLLLTDWSATISGTQVQNLILVSLLSHQQKCGTLSTMVTVMDHTPMPSYTPIKEICFNSAKVTSLIFPIPKFKSSHLFKILKTTFSKQANFHSENNLIMELSHLWVSTTMQLKQMLVIIRTALWSLSISEVLAYLLIAIWSSTTLLTLFQEVQSCVTQDKMGFVLFQTSAVKIHGWMIFPSRSTSSIIKLWMRQIITSWCLCQVCRLTGQAVRLTLSQESPFQRWTFARSMFKIVAISITSMITKSLLT